MPFVVDASVTASWALVEGDPSAELAFEKLLADYAVAPWLWWYEIRNLLIMGERSRGRSPTDTEAFIGLLSTLPIRLDYAPDQRSILHLSRKYKLTVYDTAYLELAQRLDVPLATLDSELIRAAQAAGVPLIQKSGRRGRI
jgi:predicted nucleic acid-binding protein